MTLSNNVHDDLSMVTSDIFNNSSSNWDSLYCSHLWSNSHARNAIINPNPSGNKMIKYCYKCNGKIRKYEIQTPKQLFSPNNHSTPNRKESVNTNTVPEDNHTKVTQNTRDMTQDKPIPSISRNIDSISRPKYISYEPRPKTNRRLRKGLKGIGCAVSLNLTESPVKKRTQIQACSISVMIVAIVVISFVLVNFTSPYYKNVTYSSTAVPILPLIGSNQTVSAVIVVDHALIEHEETSTSNFFTSSVEASSMPTENTQFLNLLTKIRNSIKTYPKDSKMKNPHSEGKPKEINNRDLSVKFCSCQNNEVCMLDEDSGTAICKKAVDTEDPTGCGGLCALETEACQLVDRARGVRVCRLITLMRCTSQQWRCRNGLCVDASARCDGKMQCYDKSDETNCECDLSKEFHCGHSLSCFPNTKLCDGVIDCWDAIDEVNCTAVCPDSQFTCTNGQCIPISRFCDGLVDCNDGSDEPQGCDGACGSREKRCKNRRCVPKTVFCDGADNCGDGSDELNCYLDH